MRVFRKRNKFGNFGGPPADADPIPDIVYQMGAEAAAQYVIERSRPSSPYAAMQAPGQEDIYGYPQAQLDATGIYEVPSDEYSGERRRSGPLNFIGSLFGISRSGSRERYHKEPSNNFLPRRPPPPGTPIKYRRRPGSPALVQSRVPSPVHFAQNSVPNSPDVARRLQRAQYSQDLQQLERQQRVQEELFMFNQPQFYPQYQQILQQPYFPSYPLMQQAPAIYSYY